MCGAWRIYYCRIQLLPKEKREGWATRELFGVVLLSRPDAVASRCENPVAAAATTPSTPPVLNCLEHSATFSSLPFFLLIYFQSFLLFLSSKKEKILLFPVCLCLRFRHLFSLPVRSLLSQSVWCVSVIDTLAVGRLVNSSSFSSSSRYELVYSRTRLENQSNLIAFPSQSAFLIFFSPFCFPCFS